jgi:hypothetical protein
MPTWAAAPECLGLAGWPEKLPEPAERASETPLASTSKAPTAANGEWYESGTCPSIASHVLSAHGCCARLLCMRRMPGTSPIAVLPHGLLKRHEHVTGDANPEEGLTIQSSPLLPLQSRSVCLSIRRRPTTAARHDCEAGRAGAGTKLHAAEGLGVEGFAIACMHAHW